ncbi:hypothetical protein TRIUR3_23694 [Triticum urartu]|uniref:Uncharacterized protein n=1 Tax=Triticum urartu TaxID=4572 RepID=M8A1Q2_TRIUA|nr:uncharacterized protein LOC125529929 [Triticum urartu]EMS54319.1 hypothetical protein TRIUR3_23694 [Triticum urartu]
MITQGWAAAAVVANGAGGRRGDEKKAAPGCDVEALRKCLEENKGDRAKCQAHIDAFRSSCSVSPTNTSDYRPTVQKET